jgi:hypothetical protein
VASEDSFTRMAATAAIVSLPIAAGNLVAMLATVHFNLKGMTDPVVLLRSGTAAAPLWRLSMVLDILGYYLPIVPLILLLRSSHRDGAANWADMFTLCLLGYCLIGAVGGAMLATAIPTLIRDYANASSADHRQAVQVVFTGYTDSIYRGLWNLLEELLAGIGWIGFSRVMSDDRRVLRMATSLLGVACLVDSLGTALNIDGVASAGLSLYLVLAPVWACWMGIDLLRSRAPVPFGAVTPTTVPRWQ